MPEQQRNQHLVTEKNGKYPQSFLPVYYGSASQENKTDDLDLRQLLTVVRRRAVVIGSVAMAIAASVWVWTLSSEAKYQGKFRLLVESVTGDSGSQLAELSQVAGTNTGGQNAGLDYDTQIEVLRSPELMAPIVKELSARYPDISYSSLAEHLVINRFKETKILEVGYQDSNPQKIHFVLKQLSKEFLKYSLQERQTNLRQGIEFVDAQLPQLQLRVNSLQKDLQKFRQHYNFIDPEVKGTQLIQKVDAIDLQQLEIQKQLAQARSLYAALQGQSGATLAEALARNLALQGQSGTSLTEENPINEVLQKPSGVKTAETPNNNGSANSQSGVPEAQQATIFQKLLAQLRDLDSEIGAASTRFREDSPMIQALRKKRASLLSVLQEEAARALKEKKVEVADKISSLEVQAAQIAKAKSNLNQQVKQLPFLVRQYADLQRELTVATDSLNRFLEKREGLQVEIAQKEVPWQVISAPEKPGKPISPDVSRNIMLGAIAGLLAGLGAALLAERLDNVFHSIDDLKEGTKLPLLGTIPFHKQLKPLSAATETSIEKKSGGYKLNFRNTNDTPSESYFPFLESFRSLHTNINFLGSDTSIRSLVVSSAHKGDGKSTVAAHLAQAAAAVGQQVLIVDADLRLPQVHHQMGLPNEQGLSNVIAENLPVLEFIQRSPLSENLFVLTSGPTPPDPIKLLSSKKMQHVMENLGQLFDLVIYDTPPLLGLSDSSLLAPHTDGIVLVVRMSKTNRSLVAQALDGLKISRATVLGTVCNGIEINSGYGYYNYYYRKPKAEGAS